MYSSIPRHRGAGRAGGRPLAVIIVILVVEVAVLALGGVDPVRIACVAAYSASVAVELAVLSGGVRGGARRRPLPPPVGL
ncbi:hypothetical protein GCM10009735_48630 [Actinomadura chokoriensis]